MADVYWNDADRLEFIDFIAASPDAGAVIPGSGGLRKIRWGQTGRGKRGGVRVAKCGYWRSTKKLPWKIFPLTCCGR